MQYLMAVVVVVLAAMMGYHWRKRGKLFIHAGPTLKDNPGAMSVSHMKIVKIVQGMGHDVTVITGRLVLAGRCQLCNIDGKLSFFVLEDPLGREWVYPQINVNDDVANYLKVLADAQVELFVREHANYIRSPMTV